MKFSWATRPSPSQEYVQQLETWRAKFGADAEAVKVTLLDGLASVFPQDAALLLTLHEALSFLKAYPDSPAVLRRVNRLLDEFADRPEFIRVRRKLAETGISATTTVYPFSYPMACWLALSYPTHVDIAWDDYEDPTPLDRMMILLTTPAEHPGIDDEHVSSAEWLANAAGGGNAFVSLINRFNTVCCDEVTRQSLYDSLALPLRLRLDKDFPSRTTAAINVKKVYYHHEPLQRGPVDLRRELQHVPARRRLSRSQTTQLINLARACMAVRRRELEAFDYASPDDGLLYECGRGLRIAMIGLQPARRLFLESVYGGLLLKNGVPIGYTLASGLFESSEVAYNVFETFRGGESSWVFGRVLAVVYDLFRSSDFTVMRYQIGYENDEALDSGACWFYFNLGFEPRGQAVSNLLDAERAKRRRDPHYRSPRRILRRLSQENIYFHLGKPRDELIGLFPYENIGHQVTRHIARAYGGDPIRAVQTASVNVAQRLGINDLNAWPAAQREAFCRWSVLLELFPDLDQWSSAQKRQLIRILQAKGGRHEAHFVRLSNRHRRLRASIRQLARAWTWEAPGDQQVG